MVRIPLGIALLLLVSPLPAQQSDGYRLEEHTLNAGGSPIDGATPASSTFRISMDVVGVGPLHAGLGSASYRMSGGFSAAFPPPGEIEGLLFPDDDRLTWRPDGSVGAYNLYRGALSSLGTAEFGTCAQGGLTGTSANDADQPAAGQGFFYLVTAENRLGEEGTRGVQSAGPERNGPSCP